MPKVTYINKKPEQPLQRVSDEIYTALRKSGMTKVEAAERVFGVSKPTMNLWINEPEKMPLGKLMRACRMLSIPLDTIRAALRY